MVKIKFAKLREGAIIPTKRKGDMGYDIYACFPETSIRIPHHTTIMIPTGIASVIPEGYGILLEERGSTGSEGIKRSAGVIDCNYRGEWFVALTNSNDYPVIISKDVKKRSWGENGELLYPYTKAIVQGLLLEVPDSESEEISLDELSSYGSERGAGKLGSSGK